ncbi:MAG TPA: hypothetical protein PK402_07935 [Tepidisphaeraceae bacterium]|nr:hypothetical protein [Tepidisphaeraceae bacterium]
MHTTVTTFSGRCLDLIAPDPADIDIRDIAHSLAMQCRFNGHTNRFYSVAQHTVHVSNLLDGDDALWGLLHDAAEAYVSDIPRPLKAQLPEFEVAEDRMLKAIIARFGLSAWPMTPRVKWADDTLLVTECRDLMVGLYDRIQIPGVTALLEPIAPVDSVEAERMFMDRFESLTSIR